MESADGKRPRKTLIGGREKVLTDRRRSLKREDVRREESCLTCVVVFDLCGCVLPVWLCLNLCGSVLPVWLCFTCVVVLSCVGSCV